MTKPACSIVAMVILTLVLAATGGVQAQPCSPTQPLLLYGYCASYLTDATSYPDNTCCDVILNMYNLRGANCFCDAVRSLVASNPTLNANKARALLNDCEISAGSTCSMTPASPVSPSLPAPGSDDGINTQPPGPSSPSSTTYKTAGSLNLAAPIGGGVGGITALVIILILIGKFTNMFSRCCNCHWFVNVGGRNGDGNANANVDAGGNGGLPQHTQQPNGHLNPGSATPNEGQVPPNGSYHDSDPSWNGEKAEKVPAHLAR
ncbi:uncharacterized protein [Physcomitrium patens]|uniref:uncharacterized protein isoform X1 n=1 Tax=Physcomitrium patens TaxID=3218 RepID=UPI000D17815B|nr:uncharacterized protein LOC112292249 isoform X1 [Physcomitrium patens]|eukprot:XP_024396312.1 uncharacterized protein LOC112292249 isoform X1 [Physcomitrella patens]